jgi:hypothetical protein
MFMAPLAALAAAGIRKYVLYAVGALVLAAIAFGGYQGVMRLRAIAELEHERAKTAAGDAVRAHAEIDALRRNAEISEQLVAEDLVRVRNDKLAADRLLEKIRHARPPVSPACSAVLDPLRDAARGLRDTRAARTADGNGRTAAGAATLR